MDKTQDGARIGLVGLGTMGSALALNIADKGFRIAVTNRSPDRVAAALAEAGPLAGNIVGADTPQALVAALAPPRAVLLMVPAGPAVDEQIALYRPLLRPGDILIDAGNADFHDTNRRIAALEGSGLRYLGLGVSGGAEGARHGPSMMGGGDKTAWAAVKDLLDAIAARFAGTPCATFFGAGGAGHFLKTVHNGIEYADMQMIAEIYGLLRSEGRAAADIGEIFAAWNEGPLNAYLTEVTAFVLQAEDPATGLPLVDVVADRAGQKGTGRWTVIEGEHLAAPATITAAAVAARAWSAVPEARAEGALALPPPGRVHGPVPTEGDLEKALLAGRILALSQGFTLVEAASQHYRWQLDPAAVAEVWRAGCIIRSGLLDDIARAFRDGVPHGHLMLSPHFAGRLAEALPALRRTLSSAVCAGLPVPALSAALAYADTFRSPRGTTNLIQAQRDYFGAHGFERTDTAGTHHGPWQT